MYNMPIVKPRPTAFQNLIGGFQQGMAITNALQQMAQKRRAQELAQKLAPLQMQQLQAQIAAQQAKTALTEQQAKLLGGKSGMQIQLGPTGLPYAVPTGESQTPFGINPTSFNNTSLSKLPTSTDQSQPGAQPSFLPSPIGATKTSVSAWYNPFSGEAISPLTPAGRTQMQNQLRAYERLKELTKDLRKYGTQGYGGAPLSPNLLHPASFIDQVMNPEAAPFYKMNLQSGKELLMTARGLPKSSEGLHTAEGILGRLPGEPKDVYEKRLNDFETKEADKYIRELSEALRTGGTKVQPASSMEVEKEQITKTPSEEIEKKVIVVDKNGKRYRLPQSQLDDAIRQGYRRG